MKRTIMGTIMVLICGFVNAQQKAIINITCKGAFQPAKIYLSFIAGSDLYRDSATCRNGNIRFEVPFPGITKASLYTGNGPGAYAENAGFYIGEEQTNIVIKDSIQDLKVIGSAINDGFENYQNFTKKETEKFQALNAEYGRKYKDKAALDSIRPLRKAALVELDTVNFRFIRLHPGSWFSLNKLDEMTNNYAISKMYSADGASDLVKIEQLYGQLSPRLRNSPFGKEVAVKIKGVRSTVVGGKVVDFALKAPDGSIVDTKKMRGKIYLIDFWGSWCVYCRKGHPHLKELYAKYKPAGFEIIGVGVEFGGTKEKQEKKWLKAIADDGITWKHVLNDNKIIDLPAHYGVRMYPTKLLIDGGGNIILRVTDDNERVLDAKLAELFDADKRS